MSAKCSMSLMSVGLEVRTRSQSRRRDKFPLCRAYEWCFPTHQESPRSSMALPFHRSRCWLSTDHDVLHLDQDKKDYMFKYVEEEA